MDLINRLMSPGIEIVSVILAVILTFDFADSFIHMYKDAASTRSGCSRSKIIASNFE